MRPIHLALLLASACSKPPAPGDATPTRPSETGPTETRPSETRPAETRPTGSREATCAELGQKTTDAMTALAKEVQRLGLPEVAAPKRDSRGLGRCEGDPSGEGAWIITVEKAEAKKDPPAVGAEGDPDDPEFSVRKVIALVYVAEDGSTKRWAPDPDPEDKPFNANVTRLFTTEYAIARVFDWDDDGQVDVAYSIYLRGPDLDNTYFELARVSGGAADSWKVIDDGASIVSVRDVDDDARPDLLTLRPFAWGVREDMFPETLRYLHRSVRGGFTTTDDGVKAWYKKMCGGAKVDIAAAPKSQSEGDVFDQLVCARLWGASVKDVQSKVDAFMAKNYQVEPHPLDDPNDPPYLSTVPVTLE